MISDKTIVFAGSSLFSLEPLKAVVGLGFQSVIVLTQPDKKMGRGLKTLPNPVMEFANNFGLEALSVESFEEAEIKKTLKVVSPNVLLTAAYGKLIPNWFFDCFSTDVLNIHPSLLPAWRGASPIQSAILNGDQQTGISVIRMTSSLDAGPVFLSKPAKIDKKDNSKTLSAKLSGLAATTIKKSLEKILSGKIQAKEQDHQQATFSKKIQKTDGRINWKESAELIDRKVKAYNPWPVAFTHFGDKYLRIWDTELSSDFKNYNHPGTVVEQSDEGLLVATGKGNLLLKEIQLAGKESMTAKKFTRGTNLKNKSFL